MKIRYVSDLHIDTAGNTAAAKNLFQYPIPDVLVIAGDVSNSGFKTCRFLQEVCDVFWADAKGVKIIFVPGNHEFYDTPIKATQQMLSALHNNNNNLYVLDRFNPTLRLGDYVFMGDTMWTDFSLNGNKHLAKWDALRGMADYRYVHIDAIGGPLLTPDYTEQEFIETLDYFEHSCVGLKRHEKLVCVTHHAPSCQSIHPYYKQEPFISLNPAYATGVLDQDSTSYSDILSDKVSLWIHGHMHNSSDYMAGNCRVVTNPRGYGTWDNPENPEFDASIILEI